MLYQQSDPPILGTEFLALSLRAVGYTVFANTDASGTFSSTLAANANRRMENAGVILQGMFAIVADLMRDWRDVPGSLQILPFFDQYLPAYGYVARHHEAAVLNGTLAPGEAGLWEVACWFEAVVLRWKLWPRDLALLEAVDRWGEEKGEEKTAHGSLNWKVWRGRHINILQFTVSISVLWTRVRRTDLAGFSLFPSLCRPKLKPSSVCIDEPHYNLLHEIQIPTVNLVRISSSFCASWIFSLTDIRPSSASIPPTMCNVSTFLSFDVQTMHRQQSISIQIPALWRDCCDCGAHWEIIK